jgi:hypothetical protein
VLNLVLRHGVFALGYQSSVILKFLLMNKLVHCDLHGTKAHARWFRSVSFSALAAFNFGRTTSVLTGSARNSRHGLMIVSDDGMLAAEAERAMTLHIDGVRRFAFLGREDRLDRSNELIAG